MKDTSKKCIAMLSYLIVINNSAYKNMMTTNYIIDNMHNI